MTSTTNHPPTAPRRRYRSGWCASNQHHRCTGRYGTADCACACHRQAPTQPTEPTELTEETAA